MLYSWATWKYLVIGFAVMEYLSTRAHHHGIPLCSIEGYDSSHCRCLKAETITSDLVSGYCLDSCLGSCVPHRQSPHSFMSASCLVSRQRSRPSWLRAQNLDEKAKNKQTHTHTHTHEHINRGSRAGYCELACRTVWRFTLYWDERFPAVTNGNMYYCNALQ